VVVARRSAGHRPRRGKPDRATMQLRSTLPVQLFRRAVKLLQLRRRERLQRFYDLDQAPDGDVDTAAPARLVLHVGLHKTGTTSIQQTLSREHLRLREVGVLYPAGLFFDGQHSLLFRLFSRGGEKKRRFFMSLRAMANREGCGTVILSGEQLSLLRRSSLKGLQPALEAANFTPLVVIFERSRIALLRSRMAQRMVSVANAYVTPYALSRVLRDYDPAQIRENFIAAFGAERVVVIDLSADGDAVALFAEAVGISLPTGARKNVRMDFAVMSLLNAIKADFDFSSVTLHSAYEEVFGARRQTFVAETRFLAELLEHLDPATRAEYAHEIERLGAEPPRPLSREQQIRYLRDLERFIRQLRKDLAWALQGRREARAEGKARALRRLGLTGEPDPPA
jgi:hypothetical protein